MDGFNDLNLVNEHLSGRRNEKFEGLLESGQNGERRGRRGGAGVGNGGDTHVGTLAHHISTLHSGRWTSTVATRCLLIFN